MFLHYPIREQRLFMIIWAFAVFCSRHAQKLKNKTRFRLDKPKNDLVSCSKLALSLSLLFIEIPKLLKDNEFRLHMKRYFV